MGLYRCSDDGVTRIKCRPLDPASKYSKALRARNDITSILIHGQFVRTPKKPGSEHKHIEGERSSQNDIRISLNV